MARATLVSYISGTIYSLHILGRFPTDPRLSFLFRLMVLAKLLGFGNDPIPWALVGEDKIELVKSLNKTRGAKVGFVFEFSITFLLFVSIACFILSES